MMQKPLNLSLIIFALLVLEIGMTASLAYNDFVNPSSGVCLTEGAGCDFVQSSMYSKLFGIKLSYIGFFSFLVLFAIFLYGVKNKEAPNVFLFVSGIGAIMAVYFIYLQMFVLKQICSICTVIDIVAILIFILGYLEHRHKKKWAIH